VPAPVSGRVLRTTGEPGDAVAVGSELIAFELDVERTGTKPAKVAQTAAVSEERDGDSNTSNNAAASDRPVTPVQSIEPEKSVEQKQPTEPVSANSPPTQKTGAGSEGEGRLLSSPAIRKRAKEAGVDLNLVRGSGPKGRITASDLAAYIDSASSPSTGIAGSQAKSVTFDERKVIGIRRVIAERLSQSKREIPHFAYVEEVDVVELERLRKHLNEKHGTSLSILPFVVTALLRAVEVFPQTNAHYDSETGMLRTFQGVHLGIAAQTPDGLKVPVLKDAHLKNLWQLSDAIAHLSQRARSGESKPAELSGSTITLTSLGKLGGIASTPIINRPEVAIVGVNRVSDRAMVVDGQIQVRTMMNLSSSFDHRFVDGYDAAAMIAVMKQHLEHPATMFVGIPDRGTPD
ncbi:MAG: dihydrolipoamide acetyltransferase family protein, partial [Proteobacteria bacterium]|nr:dihydrolipoamide acetyltransferase family protein [Pseudomonadota bacterium]